MFRTGRRFTMKILLAVDGSSCSEMAVDEVARRPWPAESEIKVVSVVERPTIAAMEPWEVPADYFRILEKVAHDKALAAATAASAKLNAAANQVFSVTMALPTGSPKQTILEEAEGWGADLIVVGSHGYGAWERLLLGSVSLAVASHANCLVEIVRCSKPKE
jgi:nucleotide-binding universal stress UspA family protein